MDRAEEVTARVLKAFDVEQAPKVLAKSIHSVSTHTVPVQLSAEAVNAIQNEFKKFGCVVTAEAVRTLASGGAVQHGQALDAVHSFTNLMAHG